MDPSSRIARSGFTLLLLAFLATRPALAHPFHETLTQFEHNREARTLEIALRVDAVDLEQMVGRWLGERIDLERDPRAQRSLELWLRERLAARTDQGPAPLVWIGSEFEGAFCWLYVEAPIPARARHVDLAHLVLFDWHPFPTNHVVGVGASAGFSGATTLDAPILRVPIGEPILTRAARAIVALIDALLRAARAFNEGGPTTDLSG